MASRILVVARARGIGAIATRDPTTGKKMRLGVESVKGRTVNGV